MHIKKYGRQLLIKLLSCEREACNVHDRYAVAVKMTGTTDNVGHFPWKESRVCLLFLRGGGTVDCILTEVKKISLH